MLIKTSTVDIVKVISDREELPVDDEKTRVALKKARAKQAEIAKKVDEGDICYHAIESYEELLTRN